ncbi:MAG TPA: glycosyltransferase family 2 protein [Gaiella sp.]
MTIAMTVLVRDDADILDAHLGYHLNAGVDVVLATGGGGEATTEILETYAREGVLRRVSREDVHDEAAAREELAHRAVAEAGADWIVASEADEFWLPRGESFGDVLSVIPTRYTVVQALARLFLPRPDDGRPAFERLTIRRSVYMAGEDGIASLEQALRPVVRTDRRQAGRLDDQGDRLVPLRAWYPIEVLRLPFRSLEQAERRLAGVRGEPPASWSGLERDALAAQRRGDLAAWYAERMTDEDAAGRGREDGSLVEDTRLRDALERLSESAPAGGSRRYPLPSEGARLSLAPPDIVDDAAYAGECAAVHEVDYERLERHITDLERRIASLERRLWPRVVGKLSRVVGR